MSIKVAVITTGRSDYGLLFPLLKRLEADDRFTLQLVVTGAHLSGEQGDTLGEIERDGLSVAALVALDAAEDTKLGTAQQTAQALSEIAEQYEQLAPDFVVVLGDRFETFAAASAALILDIPIGHIHGGEVTMGSLDDSFRHAITKMSALHFASTDTYARRIEQMGEQPSRVFNVGALAVDNVQETELMSPDEFAARFGVECGEDTLLVTFHPVTRGGDSLADLEELLFALNGLSDHRVLFTAANADAGGKAINQRIQEWADRQAGRAHLVPSLGRVGYLSAARNCAAVVGNSSSGLIEVPALGAASVDIGSRQEGRVRPPAVVHAGRDAQSIKEAITRAVSPEHRSYARTAPNPYGDGHSAEKIADVLASFDPQALREPVPFYDIDLEAGQ